MTDLARDLAQHREPPYTDDTRNDAWMAGFDKASHYAQLVAERAAVDGEVRAAAERPYADTPKYPTLPNSTRDGCVYLGHCDDTDLYFCKSSGNLRTYDGRDWHEKHHGDSSVCKTDRMAYALRLAKEKGLVSA